MTAALRIVNADATSEEIAALVAALLNLQSPATPNQRKGSEWPVTNRLRRAAEIRPRSWRASSLPR